MQWNLHIKSFLQRDICLTQCDCEVLIHFRIHLVFFSSKNNFLEEEEGILLFQDSAVFIFVATSFCWEDASFIFCLFLHWLCFQDILLHLVLFMLLLLLLLFVNELLVSEENLAQRGTTFPGWLGAKIWSYCLTMQEYVSVSCHFVWVEGALVYRCSLLRCCRAESFKVPL